MATHAQRPPVDFQLLEDVHQAIAPFIRTSPCVLSDALSTMCGAKVFLKLENLQRTGSFKERGALAKLLSLDADQRARGVVAASAGNHAQGVAYHAKRLNIHATICMPSNTPLIKVQRTRKLGAEVILYGESYDEAFGHARQLEREGGRVFVPAFDDPLIIAGQGSIGLELLKQNPWIDICLVPVGGGGMIAGIALALKETNPRIRVIGVESSFVPSMRASIDAGHVVPVDSRRTIADGIAVAQVGDLPFNLVRHYVDDIVAVDDEETANAILVLLEEEKTVVEAAGAVAVAALLNQKVSDLEGKRVCAVISGGNIDVNVISRIIERGLEKDGRRAHLRVTLPDVPGELAKMTSLIAELRANIIESQHSRTVFEAPLGATTVALTLETRGTDHIETIRSTLRESGYEVSEVRG